jgi:lysophospholipase L1-like esterase
MQEQLRQRRILCYGDSNTFGTLPLWKASSILYYRYEKRSRWINIMASLLGEDYQVIEEGQPGRTTIYDDAEEPFCRFCNGLTPFSAILMSHPPLDLVVIMLGTNDLHSVTPPTEETLGVGISRLIDVVASFPQAGWDNVAPPVLVVAPIPIKKALGRTEVYPKFHGAEGERLSKLFAPVYKKVAEEKGCPFLDAALYAEPCDADGVHFTQESHAAFGNAMAETVRNLFEGKHK